MAWEILLELLKTTVYFCEQEKRSCLFSKEGSKQCFESCCAPLPQNGKVARFTKGSIPLTLLHLK
jgi:hypothetical protein